MGRRRHERMKHVFPVRIWGKDKSGHSFDELAHTLDVSAGGALLAGIKHALRAGDVLSIQYKQKKAEFPAAAGLRARHFVPQKSIGRSAFLAS